MKAIEKEELGKDAITDFLTVSFFYWLCRLHNGSKIDGITRYLLAIRSNDSGVLNYLDKLRKGYYLLFLTADHGGAENVNYLKDNKYNVKSISSRY
jgi:hypothetical protein